jgi:ribonuclease III
MQVDFTQFQKNAGVAFRTPDLLRQAFTHRSYLNENRNLKLSHNERLEFLGDAVLELIVTDYLYHKYPDKSEGELTAFRSALVNAQTLAAVAARLGVNNYLLLSHGEAKDTGRARQYILANTLEAIIGALYIDQGYETAKQFVLEHVVHLIDDIIARKKFVDAKSYFQEKAQEQTGITPLYKTVKETGPDHDKKFTVGVFLVHELVATGEGRSKQEAEQEAAQKALELRGWDK